MAAQDTFNPGREQVQVTASPNLQTERQRFDPNGSVNALIQALGADSTQRELAAFNQQHEENKLREQQVKFDWYVEQFQKDHAGGAVSQAQVKARFPETVPVISARIAEAIGQNEGRKQFQAALDEVAGNDALRLDTQARADFLAKKRAEITNSIGQGNDFYGAGVVSAMDKLMAQHEINWQTETAAYHQKVQTDQLSGEVVDAFNSGNPAKLLEIDAKWKASSSLNDLERNKVVVNSAIDLAFVNDDANILKQVPDRFLNVDSKAALEKAKVQLTDRRMTDFRNAQYLKELHRTEALRKAKTDIVGAVAQGQPVDPAAYRNDPEAFQFALQMREAPRIDESTSQATAQAVRNSILTQTTVGQMGSQKDIADSILANQGLNPKEKQAILTELPKLIEGRNLMADDMVRQPVSDILGPRLQALETSTNSAIQALLTGRNLRSEVMRGYDMDIRRSFMAEFEETGKWPTGHRKLDLIDKAVDRATKRLEDATRITGSAAPGASSAAPAAPTPAPAPRPTPSAVKQSSIDAAIAAELAKRK